MKITIDTAQDSVENIRKAIRLLQALLEHSPEQGSKNIFDTPGAGLFDAPAGNPSNAFSNMFNDSAPAPQQEKRTDPKVELY